MLRWLVGRQGNWPYWCRGFQPEVHVPPGVHLPICRLQILYICNKLNLRHENGVYLYSFRILKVLFKFSRRLFVMGNFRDTCSSIEMLKEYMFRERLGTPVLVDGVNCNCVQLILLSRSSFDLELSKVKGNFQSFNFSLPGTSLFIVTRCEIFSYGQTLSKPEGLLHYGFS